MDKYQYSLSVTEDSLPGIVVCINDKYLYLAGHSYSETIDTDQSVALICGEMGNDQ